jgi:hypothetical protein
MSDLSVPVSAVFQELKKERTTEKDKVKLTPAKIHRTGIGRTTRIEPDERAGH